MPRRREESRAEARNSSIEKANWLFHNLIGLHTQPHRIASPVEARFAPAGKRFEIIGAFDEVSPFPVANSPETTPAGGLALRRTYSTY
jgi:hypothetical protein